VCVEANADKGIISACQARRMNLWAVYNASTATYGDMDAR
jgi:hypothetical protein